MNTIKIKATGIVPVIMHDNKAANPLSVYAKTMKHLTSKRNKTDADFEEIARMEWEAGLYLEEGKACIPARCLDKCLLIGARRTKDGKKYESGVFLEDNFFTLAYSGKFIDTKESGTFPTPALDKFYDSHKHQCMVKVGTAQILRTRPIFHDWSFEFTALFDEVVIDERTLIACIQNAGRYVGLLEMRPRFGRFEIEVLK